VSDARSRGGDSASDLFDAWMAHRGQPDAPEEEADRQVAGPLAVARSVAQPVAPPVPAPPVPAPAPVVPEAPAAPAVEPLSARLRAFRGEPPPPVEAQVEAPVEAAPAKPSRRKAATASA